MPHTGAVSCSIEKKAAFPSAQKGGAANGRAALRLLLSAQPTDFQCLST
jgi:hypothetical protein